MAKPFTAPLQELIQQLSAGQRRYISRQLKNLKGNSQAARLFQYLCRHPEATNAQIARFLKLPSRSTQVSVLKNLLFNQVLDILASHYAPGYLARISMLWQVLRLHTLTELGLYDYVLEKAPEILHEALNKGFHSAAIETLLLYLRAHGRTDYIYFNDAVLERLQKDVRHLQHDFAVWSNNLIARLIGDYTYVQAAYHTDDQKSIASIKEWLRPTNQNNSFPAHYNYIRAFSFLEALEERSVKESILLTGQFLDALEHKKLRELARTYPIEVGYLIHMHILSLSVHSDAHKTLTYLQQLEHLTTLSGLSDQTRQRLETFYVVAGLYAYDVLKKWMETPAALYNLLDKLIEAYQTLAKFRTLIIYFRYMRLKLNVMRNELEKAAQDANFFMEKQPHIAHLSSRHIFAHALLLAAVYYFRIKDFDNLMNAVRRAERRLKNLNLLAQDTANAIKFLKWLYYHPLTREKLCREQEKMSALEPSFQLLDHNDWIHLLAQYELEPPRQISSRSA